MIEVYWDACMLLWACRPFQTMFYTPVVGLGFKAVVWRLLYELADQEPPPWLTLERLLQVERKDSA